VTTPALPEPDEKDWTWVIQAPCPYCGFDSRAVHRDAVADLARGYAGEIGATLGRSDAATRPAPSVWSPLEYGCHVRDVCTLFAGRLQRMLTEDDPLFENWDQDETAVEDRYWQQEPAAVAAELGEAADRIAAAFAAVPPDQWHRPGRRSNGSVFTVDTFARYFLHDLAHHAWDVRGAG
jgi:hypothetical protein